MLLCLHEEAAVAIAHGYAKASGRMMGVVLHSNVGLMHGTMAIFNAWCDRVPMLILGATGPWDAAQRRPWIDWIHTASDQGALVRDYTKWDNQPGLGAGGVRGAAARGADRRHRAARPDLRQPRRRAAGSEDRRAAAAAGCRALPGSGIRCCPQAKRSRQAAQLLSAAKNPGDPGRPSQPQRSRLESARRARREAAGARLHRHQDAGRVSRPTIRCTPRRRRRSCRTAKLLRDADVVLSLDWVDTAGTLKQAWGDAPIGAKVIRVSLRCARPSRLEHGLPGPAACRRLPDVRAGRRGCRFFSMQCERGRRRSSAEAGSSRRPETTSCPSARSANAFNELDRRHGRLPVASCRSAGTARTGTSGIRSTTSAPTAAAASARGRA